MATTNTSTQQIHPVSLLKLILPGSGIALMLIIFFLFKAGEPNPAWGKYWMIRPLIFVPLAGAAGGVFYYLMDHLRYRGSWRKILANFLSLVAYVVALWLGIVLGLAGTMWN